MRNWDTSPPPREPRHHGVLSGTQGGRVRGAARAEPPCPSLLLPPPCSNLSNNKVSEIEDGAFEGAASVSELHLTVNQLESVRSGMFRGLDGLRTL